MKILHLFSNWKWTGPAEPALNLAMTTKNLGHEVAMAVGNPGEHEPHFQNQIVVRGVERIDGMILDKHIRFLANRRDSALLAELLKKRSFDVIHCHMPNDHLIAGRARAKAGLKTPIVRSDYDAQGPEPGIRTRYLLGNSTDFLIVSSKLAGLKVAERFRFPMQKLAVLEPGIDTKRFDASRDVPDKRKEYGIPPEAFVIGIVARVQFKRRFDVFLEAVKNVKAALPQFRAFIVGAGTHIDAVAKKPVQEMGLSDTVIFSGIQRHDEYVGLLKAMDVKVFLFPGSDGSCRAVREAMSMGLPVIGARRGMIPEIVEDGRTGLVIEDTPGNLTAAILDLAKNSEKRRRLGRMGAEAARKRFDLESRANACIDIYRSLARETK